jgi:uncharacterized protein YjbJ (UPF0337 family)
MNVIRLHGYRDRFSGFARELWGEITGNGELFSDGLRRRMIGRLESFQGKNNHDAKQEIDQFYSQDKLRR